MSDGLKNFLAAVIVLALLVVLFSVYGTPYDGPELNGNWKITSLKSQRKGDSGLILPGDGEEMANTSIEPGSIPELPEETEATEKFIHTSAESVCEFYEQTQAKIISKEKNKVNEMIIAFWHGVAAVLIGEASALMVAFAWMKIRGGK